ncbi:hypothetical protein L1987_87418 [Smallanthus sonchifolius]|nr:hypothetical protein L1987_87418 [Smallanthus sonchifolius]
MVGKIVFSFFSKTQNTKQTLERGGRPPPSAGFTPGDSLRQHKEVSAEVLPTVRPKAVVLVTVAGPGAVYDGDEDGWCNRELGKTAAPGITSIEHTDQLQLLPSMC